jgi:putative resolvase
MKLGEVEDDLSEDMLELRTSFCGRLYVRRSARNRTRRMLEAVEASL